MNVLVDFDPKHSMIISNLYVSVIFLSMELKP